MNYQTVFLDAGHGGLNKFGHYVTSPDKMYQHKKGVFHKGTWFYEGVFNRQVVKKVASKLDSLNIPYLIVSKSDDGKGHWRDFSLWYRVNRANWYHKMHKKGIFISSHANAFVGDEANVRGFEIHHFPGSEEGEKLAFDLLANVKELLADKIRYRPYPIVESNFYVLRKTWMPSILIEHSYFDNYEDALLLMNEEIQDRFAEAQVRTIIKFLNNGTA